MRLSRHVLGKLPLDAGDVGVHLRERAAAPRGRAPPRTRSRGVRFARAAASAACRSATSTLDATCSTRCSPRCSSTASSTSASQLVRHRGGRASQTPEAELTATSVDEVVSSHAGPAGPARPRTSRSGMTPASKLRAAWPPSLGLLLLRAPAPCRTPPPQTTAGCAFARTRASCLAPPRYTPGSRGARRHRVPVTSMRAATGRATRQPPIQQRHHLAVASPGRARNSNARRTAPDFFRVEFQTSRPLVRLHARTHRGTSPKCGRRARPPGPSPPRSPPRVSSAPTERTAASSAGKPRPSPRRTWTVSMPPSTVCTKPPAPWMSSSALSPPSSVRG